MKQFKLSEEERAKARAKYHASKAKKASAVLSQPSPAPASEGVSPPVPQNTVCEQAKPVSLEALQTREAQLLASLRGIERALKSTREEKEKVEKMKPPQQAESVLALQVALLLEKQHLGDLIHQTQHEQMFAYTVEHLHKLMVESGADSAISEVQKQFCEAFRKVIDEKAQKVECLQKDWNERWEALESPDRPSTLSTPTDSASSS